MRMGLAVEAQVAQVAQEDLAVEAQATQAQEGLAVEARAQEDLTVEVRCIILCMCVCLLLRVYVCTFVCILRAC